MVGEFYIQKNKILVNITNNIDEYKWVYTNKNYKCGTYSFTLDNIPICKCCGSPLSFTLKCGKKIKNENCYYLIINGCTNKNCDTVGKSKNNRICQNAFLPQNLIEEEHNIRTHHNIYNVEYLLNKGYNIQEIKELQNIVKKTLITNGKANKGANKKEQYIKKYGYDEGIKKMYLDNPLHIEHWTSKGFSVYEASKKISEIQSKNSNKVKKHVKITKQYLKEKGLSDIEISKYLKEKSIFSVEHWIKQGYNEKEAKEKITNIQRKNSNKRDKSKYRESSIRCQEYWIKRGYNENEAINKVKEMQNTFSLKKCIEKYGELIGTQIFKQRQINWQKTLHESNVLCNGYSKISQELFNTLIKNIQNTEHIYFAEKNFEYSIFDNNTRYVYDYVDTQCNKIIEFNGDLYHANPKIFIDTDTPNPFEQHLSAKQIWKQDATKKQIAINNGFDILYIWESDYNIDKNKEIQKCKRFLNYE